MLPRKEGPILFREIKKKRGSRCLLVTVKMMEFNGNRDNTGMACARTKIEIVIPIAPSVLFIGQEVVVYNDHPA